MIGLGATALWELWQRIAALEAAAPQQRVQRPGRKRQAGGGGKKDAEVLCRLWAALLYLPQPWTMPAIAESIGCCESTVWNYLHEMLPSIRDELPASLLAQWQPECDSVERAELAQWLAELPEGELGVDTWEQPIPRPQDNEVQKAYYSGKQQQPTRKNQVISLPKGLDIVDVVIGQQGPRSDGKRLDQTQAELPEKLPETLLFVGDKAYVGSVNTTVPHKQPPGGTLTEAEKVFNRQVSQKRVFVEPVIRTVKIFRIAKKLFRMRAAMYEQMIGCVCGLVQIRGQYA